MKARKILLIIFIAFFIGIINTNAEELQSGNYYISSSKDYSKVLDLSGALIKNSSNIQLYSGNKSYAQEWYIEKQENGYYMILLAKNHLYALDIAAGKISNSTNIQLYRKNNSMAQMWRIEKQENGYYTFYTAKDNYTIDITGGITNNGTNIDLYSANNSYAQQFSLNKVLTPKKTIEQGIYTLQINDKTLTYNNNNLVLSDNTSDLNQLYKFDYQEDGTYIIKNLDKSNYCLTVDQNLKLPNGKVTLSNCNQQENQKWVIEKNEDSYKLISYNSGYTLTNIDNNFYVTDIVENNQQIKLEKQDDINSTDIESNTTYYITSSANNNMSIDLNGGKIDNSSNIQLYKENKSYAQRWYFEKTSDGCYIISTDKNHEYVLDIKAGLFTNNSNIQLYKRNNSKAQKWHIVKKANGYYTILSYDYDYALDVSSGIITNGANIQLYASNNSYAQEFAINKYVNGSYTIEDGIYEINNNDNSLTLNSNLELKSKTQDLTNKWYIKYQNNGKYIIYSYYNYLNKLGVLNNSKLINSTITIDNNSNEWIIEKNSDNSYKIISDYNGYTMTLNNNILLENNTNLDNQKIQLNKISNTEANIVEDGYYFIRTKLEYNQVLDIKAGNISDKTNIQTYNLNSTIAQKWYIKYIDGYYKIYSNGNNNYCLSSNSNNIELETCSDTNNQKWIIQNINGNILITDTNYNSLTIDGSNVALKQMNYDTNQLFELTKTSNGISEKVLESGYYFINSALNENYVFDVDSTSPVSSTNVKLTEKKSTKTQKWYLEYNSNGYYNIRPALNQSVSMDVNGASNNDGTNISVYNTNGNIAQQYVIKQNSDSTYSIISNNGMSIDIDNGVAVENANIEANNPNDSNSQKFTFTKTRLENLVIDISAHQGVIDWQTVKRDAGIYGVIVRIAAGSAYEDSQLKNNIAALNSLGIPYGIYIYSYAENQIGTVSDLGTYHEAALEALRIINSIKKYNINPTLGIYYDLETWENGANRNWTSTDYSYIINNFDSIMTGNGYSNWKIYANLNMANNVLSPWQNRITWIAQWNSYCSYQAYYNLWQFTSSGNISGINGNVDLNYFYLD